MTIKTDDVQIGQNATATQNFVLKQGADGTCTVARGNIGATTQDILTVDVAGKVTLTQGAANAGIPNLTIYTAQTTPLPAAGVAFTASHSLGVIPPDCCLEFICLTAEQGYSIGDTIQVLNTWTGAAWYGLQLYKSSTTVGCSIPAGTAPYVMHKTTGSSATPTVANWAYRFRLRTS